MAITGVGFDGTVNETQDALRSRFLGNVLPVVDSRDDLAVTIDTGSARSVRVAAGACWVPGVMISNSVEAFLQFDIVPTAGQSRWDALVLRVNWSNNTVTLTKVNGTASAAPTETLPPGLTYNPGVLYDYVLALVKVTAGQTSPTGLTPWRMWSSKRYMADSLAPLGNATLGTEVMLKNGKRYRYQLDASNNLTWVQQGLVTTVPSPVATIATGWAFSTTYPSRYRVDATGTHLIYEITVRRTGATLRFGADGSIGDSLLCTVTGPKPDSVWGSIPVQFRCLGGVAATSLNGIAAFGYIRNDGGVCLEAGPPNAYIPTRTGAGDWSLLAQIAFTRGS
jgi:hypothetical protein